MNDTLPPLALVALVVVALAVSHSRGLFARIAIEVLFLGLIGAFLLSHRTSLPSNVADPWASALAVVWWLIVARLVANLIALARGHDRRSREARLFSDLSAAIIYITAALVILNTVLGLNIAGLLATSGVIAIVVGLALQNTLADVFSGIAIGLERPFHVGDRVSFGDNVEGKIVEMNWRSIRIQTDADLAAVPNTLVAKGYIINRSVPTRRRAASVEFEVPADVPAGVVFEQMRQATLLCPQVLTNPAPSLTIKRSGMHSSTFATDFLVADSPDVSVAKSTLLRQTRRMFRHAGIGRAMPMTRAEFLRSLVLFEALTDQEMEMIAVQLAISFPETGDVVFEQGAKSESIYLIEAGVMEISRTDADSPPEAIGRIGPGEYVGEIGLITGSPRRFTLRALTPGRIAELPGGRLKELLDANAPLNTAMERSVRRGLELLDRDAAARVVEPIGHPAEVVARIKAFFGRDVDALAAARQPQRVAVSEWPRDAAQYAPAPNEDLTREHTHAL